eukprot:g16615.t1
MGVFEEMVAFHSSCVANLPPSENRARFVLQEDKIFQTAWTNLIDVILTMAPGAPAGAQTTSQSETTSTIAETEFQVSMASDVSALHQLVKNPNSRSYQYLFNSKREKVATACEKIVVDTLAAVGAGDGGGRTRPSDAALLRAMEVLARFDIEKLEKICVNGVGSGNHLCVTLAMEALNGVLKRLHPSQAPPTWKTRLSFAKTAAETVTEKLKIELQERTRDNKPPATGAQQMSSDDLAAACVSVIGYLMQCSKLYADADLQVCAQFVPVLIHQIQHTGSRKIFLESAWALSKISCGNRFACQPQTGLTAPFLLHALLQTSAVNQKPAIRPFTVLVRRIAGLEGVAELLERFSRSSESVPIRREFTAHLCWVISEDAEDEFLTSITGADDATTIRKLLAALIAAMQEFSDSDLILEAGITAIGRLAELRFDHEVLVFFRQALDPSSATSGGVRVATLNAVCSLLLKQHGILFPAASGDATAALEELLALTNSNIGRIVEGLNKGRATGGTTSVLNMSSTQTSSMLAAATNQLNAASVALAREELGLSCRLRIILSPIRVRLDSIRTNASFAQQQASFYLETFRRATEVMVFDADSFWSGGSAAAGSTSSLIFNSSSTTTVLNEAGGPALDDGVLLRQLLEHQREGALNNSNSTAVRSLLRERLPALCVCFGELLSGEMFPKEDVPPEAFDRLTLVFCKCLQQALPVRSSSVVAGSAVGDHLLHVTSSLNSFSGGSFDWTGAGGSLGGLEQILVDWVKCYPENKKVQREALLTLGVVKQSAKPILELMQSLSFNFYTVCGAVGALMDLSRLGYTFAEEEVVTGLNVIQAALQTFSSRSREDGSLEAEAEVCVGLLASRMQRQRFAFPADSPHFVDPRASASGSLNSTSFEGYTSSTEGGPLSPLHSMQRQVSAGAYQHGGVGGPLEDAFARGDFGAFGGGTIMFGGATSSPGGGIRGHPPGSPTHNRLLG